MAISKILHMKQAKSGYMAKHLANGLKYIMDPEKTEHGRFVGGSNCIPENALQQIVDTKRHFGKLDKRQGYHFIISFEEEEVSEGTAFEIAGQFVQEYLGPDYEAVYAIHNDTEHIHAHIIFNSVRCTTGYKYDYRNGEWDRQIQPLVNRLCEEHGLSTLDMDAVQEKRERRKAGIPEEKQYVEKRMSERDKRIKRDVDQAVEDAKTYEEFLEILLYMGYGLRGKKHLAVQEVGADRGRRIDRLGDDYTEEMLRFRIERPPVPERETDCREAELFYIYIPYRNRHLTRYQKECFIRKYRVGRIHSYTKSWKYKANLQALRKLQDEYTFLEKYRIRSKEQLAEMQSVSDKKLQGIRSEKANLQEKRKSYQPIFTLLSEIDNAEMEAGLFLEGYKEFKNEYIEFQNSKHKLSELGYSINDARAAETYFQTEFERLDIKRRLILKEKRIAATLAKKVYDRQENMENTRNYEKQKEVEEHRQGEEIFKDPMRNKGVWRGGTMK